MTVAVQSKAPVQGILCVLVATIVLSLQDSIIKFLSPSFPLHEIVLWRATIAIGLTVVFAYFEGGIHVLKTRRLGLHLLRGFLLVIANLTFFLGLAAIPLAEAVAIFFVAPLFITALSVPILGEHVGIKRWLAVVTGLVGVIIIVRPADDVFEFATLLPVAAALAYAAMQMTTRRLGVTDRASTLSFYIQICFFTASIAIGLVVGDGRYASGGHASVEFLLRAWSWPDTGHFLLLSLNGLLIAIGAYMLSQAYRIAEANVIAPFEYVALPMAIFWGFMIWGDLPDGWAFVGISLIIGSGLFVFYREARKGRTIAAARPGSRIR
ncbi:MAG: DMT family transporter [Alphaproteobacteria bacterium]|nr:DMT family transporter [Alphaproteobacteria bacterium]